MKLTAKQKIEFYEAAKEQLKIRTFICSIMRTLVWHTAPKWSYDDILEIFPELLAQKPKIKNSDFIGFIGWWPSNDKASRLRALDNCINILKEQTK